MKDAASGRAGDRAVLPGDLFTETTRLMGWGAAAAGLLTGAGLALSLLSYSGTRPVNISLVFGVLVGLQLLMLLFLPFLFALRALKGGGARHALPYPILGRLLVKMLLKIKTRAAGTRAADQRNVLAAVGGIFAEKRRVYGLLFFWPLFLIAQVFSIAFNSGSLAAILIRVLTTDLAFGWQSTLQISARTIHMVVGWISLPWAWLVPADIACPTLAQIEGSRMILKDGMMQLTTPALVSWWPFLCLAIFAYGLLPRLMLWAAGRLARNHALSRLDFTHSACGRLLRRLQTPILQTRGTAAEAGGPVSPLPPDAGPPPASTPGLSDVAAIALVPLDIADQHPDSDLHAAIEKATGLSLRDVILLDDDVAADLKSLERRLARERANKRECAVFMLQEAWQPPIRESLWFIRQVRRMLGEKAPLVIGLIGKPVPGTLFTRIKADNGRVWKQKTDALGDPYLLLEAPGGTDE